MKTNQAYFAINTMAQVLGVSTSGYYGWLKHKCGQRAQDNELLSNQIEQIHRESDSTYGRPRILAELRERGFVCNHKRVGRLMRQRGLRGVSRRRGFVRTTQKDRQKRAAPDLVNRQFVASGPDRLWVADITYLPTWQGFIYLAIVLDVWSRRIVGWSIGQTMPDELVVAALNMALERRKPDHVIHHSDQGSQYTSDLLRQRCRLADVKLSMGSVGDAYDNAMAESFFASLECELIDRRVWKTKAQARREVFTWIEAWYNPRRRHSALGQTSPAQFEQRNAHQFNEATDRVKHGLTTAGTCVTGAAPPVDNPALRFTSRPKI